MNAMLYDYASEVLNYEGFGGDITTWRFDQDGLEITVSIRDTEALAEALLQGQRRQLHAYRNLLQVADVGLVLEYGHGEAHASLRHFPARGCAGMAETDAGRRLKELAEARFEAISKLIERGCGALKRAAIRKVQLVCERQFRGLHLRVRALPAPDLAPADFPDPWGAVMILLRGEARYGRLRAEVHSAGGLIVHQSAPFIRLGNAGYGTTLPRLVRSTCRQAETVPVEHAA